MGNLGALMAKSGLPSFNEDAILYLNFRRNQATFEMEFYNLGYDFNEEQCS
jgi:hypothetical protein